VFVGATNVGKIELAIEPRLISNDLRHLQPRSFSYPEGIAVEKGQELGRFNMGSTVVLVFAAGFAAQLPLARKEKLVGEATRVRADFV